MPQENNTLHRGDGEKSPPPLIFVRSDPMAGSGQSYDSSTRAGKVGIANMINNGYKKGNLTKTQAKAIAAHYGISID